MISFHAELFENAALLKHTFKKIKSLGVKVGLALNPDKNISLILPLLDQADYILIMSVYAGFPGQKFIPEVLEKIKDLRNKYKKDIEIDGGINLATVGKAVSAGANIIVVGSAIFGAADRKKAIITLREEIK
jgi:ribulose-phosphate 3-epimerase